MKRRSGAYRQDPRRPALPTRTGQGLLCRYFFFAWLFQDVGAAPDETTRWQAIRHNCNMRRHLPHYFVRWLVMASLLAGGGYLAERIWHAILLTAFCFVAVAVIAVILTVIVVAWIRLGQNSLEP